ncbi:MAG TPA: hypothetical protein VFO82_11320 [Steroidobacteraceae bacterium]|nr:hypothetical protein [Steroidobacteraceae bacterium]
MELDELKTSWQELDRRLDRLTQINLALVTDTQTRKARWRLLPVFVGAVLNVLVGGWLVGTFARFWTSHLDTPSAVAAGIALHAGSIVVVIAGVVQLLLVLRINFARPVVVLQRYLALLRAWEVRSFYAIWLGAWLLLPALLVAAVMAVGGVDLWAVAPGVVLINVAVCAAVALVSIAFHRAARRPDGRFGAWLERLLTNHSIERAKFELDEIDRFARD